MRFQRVFLVKRLSAELTFKWLFRGMRALVGVERGGQGEALVADVALEWSFSGMPVDVGLEVAFLVEAFAAVFALVKALVGMRSHVVRQVCQLFEASSTLGTFVGFFASVRVAVDLHINLLVESLPTEVANEWLVVGMRAHMSMEVGRTVECLVALRAHVGFDGCVRQSMPCQIARLSKGSAALFTVKWLITCMDAFMCSQGIGTTE